METQKQGTNRGANSNVDALVKESSFCSKCPAWKGSLGLEPTFDLYIKHLTDIFESSKRVLKNTGTLWVVIADTYASSRPMGTSDNGFYKSTIGEDSYANSTHGFDFGRSGKNSNVGLQTNSRKGRGKSGNGVQNKSLIGIPFRFAIEMINRGWIFRNDIHWFKPNCMPESVKDRFTRDHEYVFFFSKRRKYYFDKQLELTKDMKSTRNKRTTWKIPTAQFRGNSDGNHYAVYPEALIEAPIKAGCREYGIVLDMFMGAGTTAIECIKQNKFYVGIDVSEKYVNVANERIRSFKNKNNVM